jgi:hypothetical protein
LFFHADGSIQPVVQTENSVTPLGPPADIVFLDKTFGAGTYKNEIKYHDIQEENYERFVLHKIYGVMDDSVIVEGASKQEGTQAVHNLHIAGSYVEFTKVYGGPNGGRALIQLDYGVPDGTAVQVTANDKSYFLRCAGTGGWETFADTAYCIIDLAPGDGNTVRIGGSGINIRAVSVYLPPA